jgi:hypothetical protein
MKWCIVAVNRNALVKQVAPNANHRPITRYEPFRSVPKQCIRVSAHCMQLKPRSQASTCSNQGFFWTSAGDMGQHCSIARMQQKNQLLWYEQCPISPVAIYAYKSQQSDCLLTHPNSSTLVVLVQVNSNIIRETNLS